ncbi:hypothetical protein NEF87_000762 [Candidatus Lokiarchaeum ossiferum]|uniref:Uncharacterized protein n=1 Tax=Candidatus Lokiarchaeum ossiferum TaxID=2951803 RepID=A0ABY6HLU1_9ARCH|nr:hypothetical protein NEF87_000762 [Candidatus Lokiarchaeum sp. B-35]
MNSHDHPSANDEEQIQINISLDTFMPTPSVLYTYYAILKEYGMVKQVSAPLSPEKMQVNSNTIKNDIENQLVI